MPRFVACILIAVTAVTAAAEEPAVSRFQREFKAAWQAAEAALAAGDVQSAADYYARVAQLLQFEPYSHMQAARCLARLGKTDQSVDHLRRAVEFGWESLGEDLRSPDFAQTAGDPRLPPLVADSAAAAKSGFALFVPEGTDREKPVPVLIALHGLGGNARGELPFWKETANELRMALIAVRAPIRMGNSSYSWARPAARNAVDIDVIAVRRSIDDAMAALAIDYRIDPENVVLAGTSQGAWAAMNILLQSPEAFRGVVAAIPIYESVEADKLRDAFGGRRPAVAIIAGGLDKHVPKARLARDELTAAGARLEYQEFAEMGHEPPPEFARQYTAAVRFVLQRPKP